MVLFKLCFFNVCVAAEQQRKTGYCPCGKPDEDFMIACDEQGCKYEWFHFVCVGLDGESIPDGDWYCPECLGKHVFALFSLYKSGFPRKTGMWKEGRVGNQCWEICHKSAPFSNLK